MSADRLEQLKNKIYSTAKLLKLDELKEKMLKLSEEMSQPDFWKYQENAQRISQDYQDIKSEVDKWEDLEKKASELLELSKTADEAMLKEVESETKKVEMEFEKYEFVLLLNGPYDKNNAIISIHAGSGGTEAQDWAEMLLRMLLRFCEKQGWKTKIIDEARGQEAGYKSIIFAVSGKCSYGYLKSEHGVHRLVRISPFDAEKMRHTSFALIEVLPEILHESEHEIKPEDLKIDVFRSGGKGGQSVNRTDSAVRITHIPSGIVVKCQNERSQHQNKDIAMRYLKAKLLNLEEERKGREMKEIRGEFHSAEWGSQIRSYVLQPYKLVKDHRTEYEENDPDAILNGNISGFVEAYLKWNSKNS